jgi:hypothetical protein
VEDFLEEPEVIKYGGFIIKTSDLEVMELNDWMIISSK